MISIAAYLAGLAGGVPQEGQQGAQAGATGTVGLFAALLSSTQGEAAQGAANPGNEALLQLIASSETTVDPAIAAQLAELAQNDPELARLLSQGIPVVEGDVTADITIETAPQPTPEAAAQGTATPAPTPAATEIPAEGDAPAQPAPLSEAVPSAQAQPEPATAEPAVAAGAKTETVVTVTPAQAGDTEKAPAPRNTGLENALQRASETGKKNGLQNAIPRAPQAAQVQAQTGATAASETGFATAAADAETTEAETVRLRASVATGGDQSARGTVQPAAPRATIQRILDAGNGKSVIQIHERAGGEAASAASPPTLTVNVQASAASPGPVSPNTPHVPVSALAVHIAQQHNKGARRFDIMMDPPELGRIEVRLDVTRDGHVTTHLVVERSETLDLLQRDARQLERALQGAGLNTSEDGMKFSLKDQGLAQGNQDDGHNGKNGDAKPEARSDDPDANGDMPPPVRYMTTSALDIRI